MSQGKTVLALPLQRRLLVGVRKFYLSKVIAEFVFIIEIEVLVEILFIDIIVVHDHEEFFNLFDEVIIISRCLKFQRQIVKAASAKELLGFITPNRFQICTSKPGLLVNHEVPLFIYVDAVLVMSKKEGSREISRSDSMTLKKQNTNWLSQQSLS